MSTTVIADLLMADFVPRTTGRPWVERPSRQTPTIVMTAAFAASLVLCTSSNYPTNAEAEFRSQSGTGASYARLADNGTPTSSASAASADLPESTASLITALRGESGLTWEQLARVFDVSRRAVHLWASGGKMNSHNQEVAVALYQEVRAISADSPSARRQQILMPDANGRSRYDDWKRAASNKGPQVNPSPGIEAGLGV
jgi:DNA-binding transcriptional regulator YiaG